MAYPANFRYTKEHEWVDAKDGVATIGITDYAQSELGDVVFVELPEVGSDVTAGRVVGEIESTKSVGELFAPLDGTVTEANTAVVDSPELVNSDPFGEGWLVKVAFTALPDNLLSSEEYAALTGE